MSDALLIERQGRVVTLINNDPPRNRMSTYSSSRRLSSS